MEERIRQIEERNKRVELDKAWEKSFSRIATISIITYFVAVVVLYTIDAEDPFLRAFVPVLGFILSTQSLPFVKKLWMRGK
jgi:preprotein translocase subunit SecF